MKLLLLASVTLTGISSTAQGIVDQQYKDGLWYEHTVSTTHPKEDVQEHASSTCLDVTTMRREQQNLLHERQGCTTVRDGLDAGKYVLEESCSSPMPNNGQARVHVLITRLDDQHMATDMEVRFVPALNGILGSTTHVESTYQGACPDGVRPGDRLSAPDAHGRSIVTSDTFNSGDHLGRAPRTVEAPPPPPSSLAQAGTPPLSQRPAPYSAAHPAGPPISNADVIALAGAGLDDDVILAKINAASATKFDTSIDGLKTLKAGGVSNAVIKIMVGKASVAEAESAANSDDPNVMHQPGVYALIAGRDGQVHLLELEHTHAAGENTSGNTLTMAYLHTKKHVRESLNNPTSPVKIEDRNPTFYIYIPQDTDAFGGNKLSARDFELLKLRVRNKTREVETSAESITGMGASGIEDKARQPTVAQKVKPGIYMVKVANPLKPGEYAFQHELEGVFYDFTITETR